MRNELFDQDLLTTCHRAAAINLHPAQLPCLHSSSAISLSPSICAHQHSSFHLSAALSPQPLSDWVGMWTHAEKCHEEKELYVRHYEYIH